MDGTFAIVSDQKISDSSFRLVSQNRSESKKEITKILYIFVKIVEFSYLHGNQHENVWILDKMLYISAMWFFVSRILFLSELLVDIKPYM